MLYVFDDKSLTFKKVTKDVVAICMGLSMLVACIVLAVVVYRVNKIKLISQETKEIIIREAAESNKFSPEKLRAYILELNIKFPHIVYAQARLESGNFTSEVFKTNNNMFGMKVATKRPTTNKGEELGHAYYTNWRDCVVDYAFFQAQYLRDIKTEDEYFEYLRQNYAEAPNYVECLKQIIAKETK